MTMKSYPERDVGNDGEESVTMRLTIKLGVTSEIKRMKARSDILDNLRRF